MPRARGAANGGAAMSRKERRKAERAAKKARRAPSVLVKPPPGTTGSEKKREKKRRQAERQRLRTLQVAAAPPATAKRKRATERLDEDDSDEAWDGAGGSAGRGVSNGGAGGGDGREGKRARARERSSNAKRAAVPHDSNFFRLMKEQAVPLRVSSNGGAGAPVEVVDVGEDPEDAEIARLERKLGIRKKVSGEADWSKASKQFKKDGFDEDFVDFLANIDNLESHVKRRRQQSRAGVTGSEHTHEDGAESSDAYSEIPGESDEESSDAEAYARFDSEESDIDDASDGGYSDGDGNSSTGDARTGDASGGDSDGSDSDASEAEAEGVAAAKRRRLELQQTLYGETPTEVAPTHAKPAAYVPPHLRAAKARSGAGASETAELSEMRRKLERRVKGMFNRLADTNLEPMAVELRACYSEYPTNVMTEIIIDILLGAFKEGSAGMRPLVMTFAALVSYLHAAVDAIVGAKVLEAIGERFAVVAGLTHEGPRDLVAGDTSISTREANNALLFLSYLVVFGTVHSDLLCGVARDLTRRFREEDVELLLLVFQTAGFHLRGHDPGALHELLTDVQKRAKAVLNGDDDDAADLITDRTRVQMMLDTILDLRNNRQRETHKQGLERGVQLRKWVNRQASKVTEIGVDRALRIGWSALLSPQRRVRWWFEGVVGAGLDGAGATNGAAGGAGGGIVRSGAGGDAGKNMVAAADARLLKLARRQRMVTPLQKTVFVALMGADGVDSAFERLVKLNLKGPAEREIIRVLIDCCAQEKTSNRFYADVARRFCDYNQRFKFTLQLCFWDVFKKLDELQPRAAFNLARLLGSLISHFCLSLAVLKVADFAAPTPRAVLFYVALFKDLLATPSEDSVVRATFARVGAGDDKIAVRDGISLFLHRHVKPAARLEADDARRERLRARLRLARKTLDAVRDTAI